ncbi:MAG: 3D domain-containing protein [Armatimonadota bacterium]
MRFIIRLQKARLLASICVTCLIVSVLASGSVVTAEAGKGPAARITMIIDGSEWEYVTCRMTVGSVLKEAGVSLGAKDSVYPKLTAKVVPGMKIRVIRITEQVVIQKEDLPFKTITKLDPHSSSKDKVTLKKGVTGERHVKSLITFKDGVKSKSKVLHSKVVKAPVHEVVSISRSAFLSSRSGMRMRSIRMIATAYDPGPRSCGKWATGRTANGMKAGYGVVAVDPRVIRLGTKLYVEGYGFCVAGDTGGAIKGNRIDLGFATYSEAIRYGRRTVSVYVLD